MYGDSMQAMVPQYLEASMEAFRRNQVQFREAMTGAFSGGPFEAIARRNMEMFEAAAKALRVPALAMEDVSPASSPPPSTAQAAPTGAELSELKGTLAPLNQKPHKQAKSQSVRG